MITRRPLAFLLVTIVPALLLSSCGRDPVLRVNQAVVKLSPVDSNPSAMYFTVHGGPRDVKLVSVSSRSAIRVEMHESSVDAKTGMASMAKISRVPVPAGSKVEFRKGGKHVMLWGINLPARRLQRIDMEFLFSNNDRILVETPIQKITTEDGAHNGH
jgi:periplasmic copper chaperone A